MTTNGHDLDEIRSRSQMAMARLLEISKPKPGSLIVVGCSSSEIGGMRIGSGSNLEIAEAVADAIMPFFDDQVLYLAAQCCEHLNRVLVIEEACAEAKGLEVVSVVPQVKAGGAFATEVYRRMTSPVLVEKISAVAGLDIGDTLIGMHIKPIAVPVRTEITWIGHAHVNMARSRLKLVGGERSVYKKYE